MKPSAGHSAITATKRKTLNGMSITFRAITSDDLDFLRQVYASARVEELALTGWAEHQKETFLRQQFLAQHRHYQTHFAGDDFLIILLDEHPIGRLYIGRWEEEIRLIDIALLPAYRNAGIGSALIRDILTEASERGKPVRIHVETFNPALRLYQRLGFKSVEDKGVYLLMEWTPDAA